MRLTLQSVCFAGIMIRSFWMRWKTYMPDISVIKVYREDLSQMSHLAGDESNVFVLFVIPFGMSLL